MEETGVDTPAGGKADSTEVPDNLATFLEGTWVRTFQNAGLRTTGSLLIFAPGGRFISRCPGPFIDDGNECDSGDGTYAGGFDHAESQSDSFGSRFHYTGQVSVRFDDGKTDTWDLSYWTSNKHLRINGINGDTGQAHKRYVSFASFEEAESLCPEQVDSFAVPENCSGRWGIKEAFTVAPGWGPCRYEVSCALADKGEYCQDNFLQEEELDRGYSAQGDDVRCDQEQGFYCNTIEHVCKERRSYGEVCNDPADPFTYCTGACSEGPDSDVAGTCVIAAGKRCRLGVQACENGYACVPDIGQYGLCEPA